MLLALAACLMVATPAAARTLREAADAGAVPEMTAEEKAEVSALFDA